jgi:hypothetical protein
MIPVDALLFVAWIITLFHFGKSMPGSIQNVDECYERHFRKNMQNPTALPQVSTLLLLCSYFVLCNDCAAFIFSQYQSYVTGDAVHQPFASDMPAKHAAQYAMPVQQPYAVAIPVQTAVAVPVNAMGKAPAGPQ